MNAIIEAIKQGLLSVFKFEELVTVLISILPIVEARGAIPIGMGYNLGAFWSWFYAFLGSSLIVPVLLLVLLPFVKWLSGTKIFKKIGKVIYEKFEKGAKDIKTDDISAFEKKTYEEMTDEEKAKFNKNERKKYLGVFIFVLIPLPLTGVWTGSAIAAMLKLDFWKSCAAIILGNLFASLIILALCVLFEPYINIITLIIGIIAVIIVLALIIKIIFHKEKSKE